MPYSRNSELPASVRNALPEEAQTLFRSAFNAASENNSEESSFRIAWAAVKRGWVQEGGKWKKKTRDSIAVEEVVAFDAAQSTKTPQGYLRSAPLVARTGIQVYGGDELGRSDMARVSVYRPADEVFATDTLVSFAHLPMTNDHPPEMVDAHNWRRYAVGNTGDEVLRDGDRIRVPLVVMDAEAVRDIEAGKRQLSMGYSMDLEWQAGETPEGEAYDAIARNIRCNHCAVVDAARGGPELRIADRNRETVVIDREESTMELKTIVVDGISVQMTDAAAQVFERYRVATDAGLKAAKDDLMAATARVTALTADNAKLATEHKAALDARDGEIATLKKKVADLEASSTPAAIDQRVKDRSGLVERAKKILSNVVVDGKTDAEIRRQVVDAKLGSAAQGKSDDWVGASFDTMTIVPSGDRDYRIALANPQNSNQTSQDAARTAYEESIRDTQNAWKNPKPVATAN